MAELAEYILAHNKIVEEYVAKKQFVDDIQSENVTRQMCKNMVAAIIKFGLTKPAILEPALEAVQMMMHEYVYSIDDESRFNYDVFQKKIIDVVLAANASEVNELNPSSVLTNAVSKASCIDTAAAIKYLPTYKTSDDDELDKLYWLVELFMKANKVIYATRNCLSSAITSVHVPTIASAISAVNCAEKYANEMMDDIVSIVCNNTYGALYYVVRIHEMYRL